MNMNILNKEKLLVIANFVSDWLKVSVQSLFINLSFANRLEFSGRKSHLNAKLVKYSIS